MSKRIPAAQPAPNALLTRTNIACRLLQEGASSANQIICNKRRRSLDCRREPQGTA
jgi:hypothetical protein